MAEVKIDIEAMGQLVSSLTSARSDAKAAALEVRSNLSLVWLSEPGLDRVLALDGEIDAALRDLNRRLALARLIEKSTPGLSVVSFDDSALSDASPAEIAKQVDRIATLMKTGEDDWLNGKDIDPELLKLLGGKNATDPYFAQALAAKLSPELLDHYLQAVNRKRELDLATNRSALDGFDARYRSLLSNLGTSLSLASRGTGTLAVPGMTKAWDDYLKKTGDVDVNSARRLSLVIEQGQWSSSFLEGAYRTIRGVEGSDGAHHWSLDSGFNTYDPFGPLDSQGNRLLKDPMTGVCQAMQYDPQAVRDLFGSGDRTTIQVNGKDVTVNQELWSFIHDRGVLDDRTLSTFMQAVQAGVAAPPVAGQPAWQAGLAQDVQNAGTALQAEYEQYKKDHPWWKTLGHALLDLASMVPVVGQLADVANGIWYSVDGEVANAALSFGSAALPAAAWVIRGGKWTKIVLKGEELQQFERATKDAESFRIFAKDGTVLRHVDTADPKDFEPDRFFSPMELQRYADMPWFKKMLAGNRFNAYANANYQYSEIALTTGRKARFRLDAYTPGQAIVSRKLTQLSEVTQSTALKYIDEFATKYPAGTKIADTAKNRGLGIAGQRLRGEMRLEVPPQSGAIDDAVLEHAFENNIHIVDVGGHDYTKALFDAHR